MSDKSQDSSGTRRDFLATGARTLLLGGLVGFFVHQVLRGRRLEGDPSCIKLHTCQDCLELSSGCRLPKADDFRAGYGVSRCSGFHAPRLRVAAATR